ncbi:hypothetical protein FHX08_006328 [Rhizobium sp. BK529]|uniref:hypothetical protein n=1 Tax=Rhizobium sp. BK529 TaxID=2586983 RepID=UPI0016142E15|nr:hypothetical protein [Rhizobium sp. BK529]MBB3595908.1 hypothetical protein [Rhizobium sp. BK529]
MRVIIESRFGFMPGEYPDSASLDRAQECVDEFLLFVKANDIGSDIIDEIELPVPKGFLIGAFSIVIAAERRPDVRNLLIKAGVSLAQYRPGLGPRIRIRPGSPRWRPEPSMAKGAALRLERTLDSVAWERVQLAEAYLGVIRRSLN